MRIEHVDGSFMFGSSYEFRIGYDVMRDGFAVYLVCVGPGGLVTHVAQPVVFAPVETDELRANAEEPTFRMGANLLQQLATAIQKQTGIKPESTSKIEGILEATKAHLADMRLMAGVLDGPIERDK